MDRSQNKSSAKPSTRALLLGSGPEGSAWAALLLGIVISPVLAYSLPEKPFDLWPWSKVFADFVAGWSLMIDELTAVSRMPQVTRLFMSVLWAVWFPVCALLLFTFGRATEQSVLRALTIGQGRWWFFMITPFMMVVALLWIVLLPNLSGGLSDTPFDWLMAAMSRSRVWLGFVGSTMILIAAFALVAILKSFVLMRLAYRVRKSTPLYGKY